MQKYTFSLSKVLLTIVGMILTTSFYACSGGGSKKPDDSILTDTSSKMSQEACVQNDVGEYVCQLPEGVEVEDATCFVGGENGTPVGCRVEGDKIVLDKLSDDVGGEVCLMGSDGACKSIGKISIDEKKKEDEETKTEEEKLVKEELGGCQVDSDCPAEQSCQSGTCKTPTTTPPADVECSDAKPCAEGQICQENKCVVKIEPTPAPVSTPAPENPKNTNEQDPKKDEPISSKPKNNDPIKPSLTLTPKHNTQLGLVEMTLVTNNAKKGYLSWEKEYEKENCELWGPDGKPINIKQPVNNQQKKESKFSPLGDDLVPDSKKVDLSKNFSKDVVPVKNIKNTLVCEWNLDPLLPSKEDLKLSMTMQHKKETYKVCVQSSGGSVICSDPAVVTLPSSKIIDVDFTIDPKEPKVFLTINRENATLFRIYGCGKSPASLKTVWAPKDDKAGDGLLDKIECPFNVGEYYTIEAANIGGETKVSYKLDCGISEKSLDAVPPQNEDWYKDNGGNQYKEYKKDGKTVPCKEDGDCTTEVCGNFKEETVGTCLAETTEDGQEIKCTKKEDCKKYGYCVNMVTTKSGICLEEKTGVEALKEWKNDPEYPQYEFIPLSHFNKAEGKIYKIAEGSTAWWSEVNDESFVTLQGDTYHLCSLKRKNPDDETWTDDYLNGGKDQIEVPWGINNAALEARYEKPGNTWNTIVCDTAFTFDEGYKKDDKSEIIITKKGSRQRITATLKRDQQCHQYFFNMTTSFGAFATAPITASYQPMLKVEGLSQSNSCPNKNDTRILKSAHLKILTVSCTSATGTSESYDYPGTFYTYTKTITVSQMTGLTSDGKNIPSGNYYCTYSGTRWDSTEWKSGISEYFSCP